MTADDQLVRWRSWLDKGAIPEGWHKNLWDEFYAMQHRRATLNGYREMVLASPEQAQRSARWLTQVVVQNHIDAQAAAIRRFVNPSRDPRVVSFGRILLEVAERADVLREETTRDAKTDLAELTKRAERVTTFASKEVAHLDRDYATAIAEFTPLTEIDAAIDFIGGLWERWYVRITGASAPNEAPIAEDWWKVLRFQRIEQAWEREVRLARERMDLGTPSDG